MRLKEVISGNEIITNNQWLFAGHHGNRVFIKGYLAPQDKNKIGFDFAKNKLLNLLKEKDFTLVAPEFWSIYGHEVLVCDLFLNDIHIKNYFPEYRSEGTAQQMPQPFEQTETAATTQTNNDPNEDL